MQAMDYGIAAYCDSDWGGEKSDQKSCTGFFIYVCVGGGGCLLSWIPKKQPTDYGGVFKHRGRVLGNCHHSAENRGHVIVVERARGVGTSTTQDPQRKLRGNIYCLKSNQPHQTEAC